MKDARLLAALKLGALAEKAGCQCTSLVAIRRVRLLLVFARALHGAPDLPAAAALGHDHVVLAVDELLLADVAFLGELPQLLADLMVVLHILHTHHQSEFLVLVGFEHPAVLSTILKLFSNLYNKYMFNFSKLINTKLIKHEIFKPV